MLSMTDEASAPRPRRAKMASTRAASQSGTSAPRGRTAQPATSRLAAPTAERNREIGITASLESVQLGRIGREDAIAGLFVRRPVEHEIEQPRVVRQRTAVRLQVRM